MNITADEVGLRALEQHIEKLTSDLANVLEAVAALTSRIEQLEEEVHSGRAHATGSSDGSHSRARKSK